MKKRSLFITLVIIIIGLGFIFQNHDLSDTGNVEAAVEVEDRTGNKDLNLTAVIVKPQAGEPTNNIHLGDIEGASLFIIDDNSTWADAEVAMVRQVLTNTFSALAWVGLSGDDLIDGYRFRRYDGEYVDGKQGLVGTADHGAQVITLSDAAFKRLNGFYVYHELGHAVDSRLDRRLSEAFHSQIGAGNGNAGNWKTRDGYWMRKQTRDDREEATADAFALWVTVNFAGSKPPVFAGTPLDVQYDGISQAAEQAMLISSNSH